MSLPELHCASGFRSARSVLLVNGFNSERINDSNNELPAHPQVIARTVQPNATVGGFLKWSAFQVVLNTIPFRHWRNECAAISGHSWMRQPAANQLPHLTA